MSTQTPQTDALVIAADGCKSVYPGEEFKPNPDWKFEPEIDAIIALARTLEADRDRLKALCEELARLCEKALTRSAIVHPGFADEIRAALKKAQKP
jgi:hypothetical protein